jgi:cytochrome oxidase Cu insertion factor (SCO1/SenC/PrrC family)
VNYVNKEENLQYSSTRASGQFKLWAIIVLSAAPIALAAYMYFGHVWVPDGTTNKGSFILPPLSSEMLGVARLHAEEPEFQQLDGHQKWLIVLIADSACDQRCEHSLFTARQVNIALGKDANRVGRLLLFTQPDERLEELLKDHPGLIKKMVNQSTIDEVIEAVAEHDLLLNSYDMLLMDPLGNIMMHYKSEQNGKDLLDDLKRLLKVSKIG